MLETEVTIKKWGSSLGVLLPKKEAQKEGLKEGQRIRIRVLPKESPLKKMFGTLKFKKTTDQIMRELDRELDHD